MEAVFLKVLNMSLTATWLALAVIVLRLVLKKVPKALMVALWGLVGIRLCCPFSFESALSLIPSPEPIPQDIVYADIPAIHSGIPFLNDTINPILSGSMAPNVGDSVNPMQVVTFVASAVWAVGICLMLLYMAVSFLSVRAKVREAALLKEIIWICDSIGTPFILGIVRPRIYLPSSLGEKDTEYVLAHERAHLKRKDHWWKPLGFLLLALHWFNPILWIAYVLLCRDIEVACDEKVLREKGVEIKKPYSEALINCSVPRRSIAACPLAFGEVGVKERVKKVLNYKKPAFWIIIAAVIALIVTAVCLLTDPVRDKPGEPTATTGSALDATDPSIVEPSDVSMAEQIERILGICGYECVEDPADLPFSEYLGGKCTTMLIQDSAGYISVFEYESRELAYADVQRLSINGAVYTAEDGTEYDMLTEWGATPYWYLDGNNIIYYLGDNLEILHTLTSRYGAPFAGSETQTSQPPIIEMLKKKYPHLFGLDVSGGVNVYIWQMAHNSYSCVLRPKSERVPDLKEILGYSGTSIEEMRQILSSYDLPREKVSVIPVIHPLSSYGYTIDEAYQAMLEDVFWNAEMLYDTVRYDIDGDGKEEVCVLACGPTSGIFSFRMYAREGEKIEYDTCFLVESAFYTLSFAETDGKLKVQGRTDGTHPRIDLFDISIEDGQIVLTRDGEALTVVGHPPAEGQ